MAQTGYTPISIYYSATATNTPTAGNLVSGELAINTADGKLFYKDSAGVVQVIGTKGGVGSSTTTQVLYNSSGLVVGSANMTFNGTTLTLANDASISGLTVGKGGGADTEGTAVGYQALNVNSGTNGNAAFGYQTLLANTSGTYNVGVGKQALKANTSGAYNNAVGVFSLYYNTTGGNNTAQGYQSLFNNTTASNNTAVGYQAGYSNTAGLNSTFIGYQAGYASVQTGGVNNCFVGYSSGSAVTTGYANTNIGSYTGNGGGLDIRTAANYIVLSDGAGNPRVAVNNNGDTLFGGLKTDPTFNRVNGVNIGNNGSILSRSAGGWDCGLSTTSGNNIGFYTDNGSNRVNAGYISSNGSVTAYNVTSDYRLKQNIAPLQNALSKVLQLKPCSYNYIEGNQYSEGFVAHELQAIIPEAVTGEKDAVNEDGSIKAQGVDTSFLVATLTAAIQELKAEFDAYKATHP